MVPPRSAFHPEERDLPPDLLRRVAGRDRAAMESFFEHYYERVLAHVVNLTRDRTLADDLCQNVFLKLHGVIDRLDPERDPTGWVFTVATNVVRDHWRSRAHKTTEREAGVDDPTMLDVAHPDPGVQAAMEKDEELRAVWSALQDLSPDDREIILLRDYEELDTAAVAAALDITTDAVRQRHSRAVKRLGERFRRRKDGPRS